MERAGARGRRRGGAAGARRAAGSPFCAAPAATAATASSPRGCSRQRGYPVELGLLGDRARRLRGDPALAAARYRRRGPRPPRRSISPAPTRRRRAVRRRALARDIDGEAQGDRRADQRFRALRRPVLAVDVPSGVDGATGRVRGVAVEASASVTFFRLKPGHLLLPGRALCGRDPARRHRHPGKRSAAIAPQAFVNAPAVWRDALPRLDARSHKYARGAALVLSGAAHHTGAARLAARAALARGRGARRAREPARRGRGQRRPSTAVMVAPFAGAARVRGAARRRAPARRALGPGAGVGADTRELVAAALTRPAKAAADRARRRRADELRRRRRRARGADRARRPCGRA